MITNSNKELTKSEIDDMLLGKWIIIGNHALERLMAYERSLSNPNVLLRIVKSRYPQRAYQQPNGNFRFYYRVSKGYLEVILLVKESKIVIMTFMDVNELPRI